MTEPRDIEKDKAKIEQYWEMDYIEDGDDIQEILTISEHYISRCEKLAKRAALNFEQSVEALNENEVLKARIAELERDNARLNAAVSDYVLDELKALEDRT